jgi:hypothetical protein
VKGSPSARENVPVPDGPVVVNLPDPSVAPGYRDSLGSMSEFAVKDFDGSVAVEPREGAGATRAWFTAVRLCDATSELSDDTWEPLREHPPREHDVDRRNTLLGHADKLAQAPQDDLPRQLRALRARVFAHGPELPDFLQGQMPLLFPNLPGGSLWFVRTDEALLARFAFLRAQLALALTPDIPVRRDEFEGLRLLESHSLTHGTDFAGALEVPTLIFSPAVTGLVMSCPPHALVLFFGAGLELRQDVEESFNRLFTPRVLERHLTWTNPSFFQELPGDEVEQLLPWWVDRLNVLYSHAADPTRFATQLGAHDPSAQTAWHLTMERVLADVVLLLADPNAPDLVRSQLAFDLLDKCESLLGYSQSGPGFKELLRRSKTVRRLNACWDTLPEELRRRYRTHTRAVFDSFYEDIRENTLGHRVTRRGVLVSRRQGERPAPMSMDEYASSMMRVIRNTAHGLARPLRGDTSLLLATNGGSVPTQLSDVAALVAFGLAADADKLCRGSWW